MRSAFSARPATAHRNYYSPLSIDANSIAVDSGASDGFGDIDTPGTARKATEYGITMASATGDCRVSIATDKFDLPLPPECLDFHVFKRGDIQRPLLSVGKACDAGCRVTFDKDTCRFTKDAKHLLTGFRDTRTGLYLLPTPTKRTEDASGTTTQEVVKREGTGVAMAATNSTTAATQQPCNALSAYKIHNIPKLVQFLHACAGFPTTTTWLQAINRGYFMGWPGLTTARVRRHLPESEITTKGHLQLVRQNQRSTKEVDPPRVTNTLGRRRNVGACSMQLSELKGLIGTDQTGRFPITSGRGHKYIFILCDVDTNFIYGVPITSRKSSELVRAFREAYGVLVRCGFEPVLQRLDHETSVDLIHEIEAKGLDYELAPPGNHRQNPAERAIQSYKSHLISIINGADERYPDDAWDYLIPQTNITLNLLRECSINPAHSAYSYIYGPYDFNAHPLAPLGCRAIVHERASGKGGKRGSWGNRGKIGYYVGPAMKSYRTWCFYVPDTKATIETDTAQFYPKIALPTVSTATQIAAAMDTIKDAITNPRPPYTDIAERSEHDRIDVIINQLRSMYQTPPPATPATLPRVSKPSVCDDAGPPRVPTKAEQYTGINRYRPKKKQRFPIGTRVRVVEKKQGGRKQTLIGKATRYDPDTGLYYVEFDDGEYEEFDDDEMRYFQLIKPHKPRQPYTSANQITVTGFFPKAKASPLRLLDLGDGRGVYNGLNAGSIWDDELHKWMAYRDLIRHPNKKIRDRWNQAGVNEFARLTQGHDGREGLDVITFIPRSEMPSDKQATYARYVVDYRPEKDEPWRLRITCGGDKLEYRGDTTTHSATMETIKLQLNNIVSTPGARAATGDISNMYLNSDLPEAEFVRFRIELIPTEIATAYKLHEMVTKDGYVYARVNKAWYGLKQAGKIAHDDLVDHLETAGYVKTLVEGYFRHESRDIDFTLVVDDFLIRYTRDEDLEHLNEAISDHYTFKVDMESKQYVGINLKWDYNKRTVRLSMDGYVKQALMELEHTARDKPCHAPSRYDLPKYGSRIQYAKVDETAPLTPDKINFIQRAVGKLLYYARAVDPTMLHAINDISLCATKGTEATLDATMFLLNYAHSHPNAEIIYRTSDMILRVDSDAAYLVAPEARSRAGGYHYLSDKAGTIFNGPITVIAKVIKNVMASAAEAELGALFMNAQEAVGLRNCLEAMGYPQPATPLKTDNSCANGIINNTMKQKRSKAIDVRFYWLRDRVKQGQFFVFWDAGKNNLADFATKHHPPAHHKQVRPIYTFIEDLSPESLQGCIKIMNGNRKDGQTVTQNAASHPNKPLATALMALHWTVDKGRRCLSHNIL